MDNAAAGRVAREQFLIRAAVWQLSSSSGTGLRSSHQVVTGPHQISAKAGRVDSSIAGAPQVSDRFDPTEDLFDSLAQALTSLHNPANGWCEDRAPSLLAAVSSGGPATPQVDHYPVAILYQDALDVTQPSLFTGALLGQLGFRVGSRLVSRVSAPLAVEVNACVTPIIYALV
jgi:hypothetical protein